MTEEEIKQVKKVDLGCGGNIRPGYVGLDLYHDADIQADICNQPFDDDQVEDIVAYHVLEHLPLKRVELALRECYRVLRIGGGKIFIEVPDFEKNLYRWLESNDEIRWGVAHERIFGLQNQPGEYHQTGFTNRRLKFLLSKTGFRDIVVEKKYNRSDFQSIYDDYVITARATKYG